MTQSPIQEVMEEESSTSSRLREEAIHTATVEVDMNESHYNYEVGQKTSGLEG